MANAAIMIGWQRAYVGREQTSMKGFGEFIGYLTGLQREKRIDNFEPVFLRPHGGDLNGFILIRGDAAKLAELRATEQWKDWEIWGAYNLQGFGSNDCIIGDAVGETMGRWAKVIAG